MTFELRPYQKECVDKVIEDLETFSKIGVIMPTGTGKTEVMLAIASRFIEAEERKVLILSHLGLLVGQTAKRSLSRFPHLKVGYCQAKRLPKETDDLIVGTMQSAKFDEKLVNLGDVGLIIIDECHMLMTKTYDDILKRYPHCDLVGFTATPFRERQLMTNYFDKISYSVSMDTMIEGRHLVKPTIIGMLQLSQGITGVVADTVKLIREKERDSQTIVYMNSKVGCSLVRNALVDEGIECAVVVGTTAQRTRDSHFRRFSKGELKVLITVNVLTAGFDSPNVNCIIMPYRTSSPTTYMQRIGRGLRPYQDKTECRVYVFGKEPKVEKKFYERMTALVLAGKADPSKHDLIEMMEIAKLNEQDETYEWGKEMVKIHRDLANHDHHWVADMLMQHTLPKVLESKIIELHDYITSKQRKKALKSPATDKQRNFLQILGLQEVPLETLSKNEATDLIWILHGKKNDPHVLKEGMHKGKHVRDLPWAYRSIVLKQMPNSHTADIIRKWQQTVKQLQETKQ